MAAVRDGRLQVTRDHAAEREEIAAARGVRVARASARAFVRSGNRCSWTWRSSSAPGPSMLTPSTTQLLAPADHLGSSDTFI